MIDFTGNNLRIVIDCPYNVGANWMAFAAWYSIDKFLPDAQVIVAPERGISKFALFNWVYKCGVPCLFHSSNVDYSKLFVNVEDVLVISCAVMAIRGYNEFGVVGPLSVKSSELPTFVDYSEGVGSFVVPDWINRFDGPFLKDNFNGLMNANELKIIKLFKKMAPIYSEVSK